jgi:hypothetical protein
MWGKVTGYFMITSNNLSGETEEKDKKSQVRIAGSQIGFKLWHFQNANCHCANLLSCNTNFTARSKNTYFCMTT